MTDLTENQCALAELITDDSERVVDKAGFSRLNLWLDARIQNRQATHECVERDLISVMANIDLLQQGRWSSVAYVIESLDLKSMVLANAIEAQLIDNGKLTAADEFSAWQAFHLSGGFFSPKHLNGRARVIRERAPVKWLVLALLAHAGNPPMLEAAIGDMVFEGLLQPGDIETRHREIKAAIGNSSFAGFLSAMVSRSNDVAFRDHLISWARDRHEIHLPPEPTVVPLPNHPLSGMGILHGYLDGVPSCNFQNTQSIEVVS